MHVAEAKAVAAAVGAVAITIDDEHYPPLLRAIHDPPPLLFVRGDPAVLREPHLAIVGSRRASPAGLQLAQTLSSQLVGAGLQICSGLALGIDGAAHRGALSAGGRSVGVMATGIDRVYPQRHQSLAVQMERSGCLVTEFPPGMPPLRQNFPQRNRIISGLSLGVLVIEAALPSGTLITAGAALEQGREVFALPWSALHPGGRGCLQLIRDGAKMVCEVDDILEELGPLYTLQRQAAAVPNPASEPTPASWLLPFIGYEAIALDVLVRCSARPVAQVLAEISVLELAGLVAKIAGGYTRSQR